MDWCMGWGRVAVLEPKFEAPAPPAGTGVFRALGKANTRDARRRAPPGDVLILAMGCVKL